jgi:hypothetical protein
MDTDGDNFLAAIRQVRKLMEEVATLLLEVDGLMGREGWEPRSGSTTLSGGSTSINWAKNWLPYHVFRFYKNSEHPTLIPCVTVLMDTNQPKVKLKEPYISALAMAYEAGSPLPEGWQLYSSANWHLFVPNRKDDGTLNICEPRKLWPNDSTAKRMVSFAVPLVDVKDRHMLQSLITTPLLQALTSA